MKELTVFVTEWCPHCKKAKSLIADICAEQRELAAVPIRIVDEEKHKELADKHDYDFVPCFYVDGEKIHEGKVNRECVLNVLNKAAEK